MTKVAVIYYSATGNVHALAEAVAGGAAEAGAQVRLRRVAEVCGEVPTDPRGALTLRIALVLGRLETLS